MAGQFVITSNDRFADVNRVGRPLASCGTRESRPEAVGSLVVSGISRPPITPLDCPYRPDANHHCDGGRSGKTSFGHPARTGPTPTIIATATSS
jgi:hypothetical protein